MLSICSQALFSSKQTYCHVIEGKIRNTECKTEEGQIPNFSF